MALYDDVDIDKKELSGQKSDVSGWSAGYKLLHSTTSAKKPSAALNPVSQRKRGTTALAPVVDLKRPGGSALSSGSGSSLVGYGYAGGESGPSLGAGGEIRFNHSTGKMESGPPPSSYSYLGVEVYPNESVFGGLTVEYDPRFPNEYTDFSRRLRKERERERDAEKRREEEARERRKEEERKERLERVASSFKPPNSLYEEPVEPVPDPTPAKLTDGTKRLALYDSDSDSDSDDEPIQKPSANSMFAPPPSLMEESKPMTPPPPTFHEPPVQAFAIEGKGGTVASKIMAKMGYRHGSGLGRDEQGMSMALQVEKTGRRAGKIVSEKDMAIKEASSGPAKAETGITNTELLRNPSKVLLLMNMVGPGDVDDDLEPETAEECAKYGKVVKCSIYEALGVPDILAVRIFVEFENISSSIKAAIDLNGRFFGGRVVRASFYSHEKFLNGNLVDEPL